MTATPHAYLPPALEHGRAWGFAVNLYAVRSSRNWGIGDFTDLQALVAWSASIGADTVGLNPLHALHYVDPDAASPYGPTSRYFLNPIYLDIEAVPEFAADQPAARALRERVASRAFVETLDALRATTHVQYGRVARAKWSALEALYNIFRMTKGQRREAFRAFAERRGERLERFAIYEALTEHFATKNGQVRGWLTWPQDYRDVTSPAVREWAAKARRRVDYFKFLQFLADEQLRAAASAAHVLAIGLYLDCAVGSDVNSADVWSDPGAFIIDETLGAPPDPLGPLGQNWGLPAPDPAAMLRDDGLSFRELLTANMTYAGALRLDHVMALFRLFRIPRGKTAAEGVYVAYPFEELVEFASTASRSARCLFVGEDLGSIPDGFRERMERAGIFSYRLLLFERRQDGEFLSPATYPELALATATTHDLPTLVGWATGRDVDTREGIGVMAKDVADDARSVRRVEASQLLAALQLAGELDDAAFQALHRTLDARSLEVSSYDSLIRAAYRFLAITPSRLVLVQLDDALGEFEQINLPGTFTEYPNWRRKSGLDIAGIASDTRVASLAADVRIRVKGDAAR